MDYRLKTFEEETSQAFGFLVERGFTSSVEFPEDAGPRPITLTVRFIRETVAVEIRLSLGFGGEDYLHTTVNSVAGIRELDPLVARKGHEVRKALGVLAAQTRTELAMG